MSVSYAATGLALPKRVVSPGVAIAVLALLFQWILASACGVYFVRGALVAVMTMPGLRRSGTVWPRVHGVWRWLVRLAVIVWTLLQKLGAPHAHT